MILFDKIQASNHKSSEYNLLFLDISEKSFGVIAPYVPTLLIVTLLRWNFVIMTKIYLDFVRDVAKFYGTVSAKIYSATMEKSLVMRHVDVSRYFHIYFAFYYESKRQICK